MDRRRKEEMRKNVENSVESVNKLLFPFLILFVFLNGFVLLYTITINGK